jgi:hypothetical protein
LTTAQLLRELANQRELFEAIISALDAKMDATWRLHRADITISQESVTSFREVVFEKFHERDLRFHEKDTARQAAVDAALHTARELAETKAAASQEAAAKFQEAIVRQLETQSRLNSEAANRLAEQIRSLERRMDRGEGSTAGAQGQRAEYRLNVNTVLQAMAVLVAAFILYATFHR